MELTRREQELRKQEENSIFNRAIAADASPICKMFQESGLDVKEKKDILRAVMMDHKSKEMEKVAQAGKKKA